jgi:hypothetical protein
MKRITVDKLIMRFGLLILLGLILSLSKDEA